MLELENQISMMNSNLATAVKAYKAEDNRHSSGTGRLLDNSEIDGCNFVTNGLWLVLWKGKFACIINSKVEIAAIVHFDDSGNLVPQSEGVNALITKGRTTPKSSTYN